MFFIVCSAIIYFNSPIHYKSSTIINYLYYNIVAILLISFFNNIVSDGVDSVGGIFIFIFSSLSISYLLLLSQ